MAFNPNKFKKVFPLALVAALGLVACEGKNEAQRSDAARPIPSSVSSFETSERHILLTEPAESGDTITSGWTTEFSDGVVNGLLTYNDGNPFDVTLSCDGMNKSQLNTYLMGRRAITENGNAICQDGAVSPDDAPALSNYVQTVVASIMQGR
jgi:hypothetical protein